MSKLSLSASVIALVLGATACLDHTQGPLEQGTNVLRDGSISGSFTTAEIKSHPKGITLTASDVGGDGTIVNSETYSNLEHGFSLALPGGHYKVDFTEPGGIVLATYSDVVVDGDVKLAPQNAAE